MNRKEQLRGVVERIDNSTPNNGKLPGIIDELVESGIYSGMHVGKEPEFFFEDLDTRVPEWLMGQFIEGFEKQSFLAYNAGINLSMSFLEGTYPMPLKDGE